MIGYNNHLPDDDNLWMIILYQDQCKCVIYAASWLFQNTYRDIGQGEHLYQMVDYAGDQNFCR